jgi:NADH-dependent peroxiredoxin subunit F
MYDLVIIGAGPAGTSAGVYAARKQLKTLLITKEFGGQSTVSVDVQNWIGTPHIPGPDLATIFKKHLEEYKGDFLEMLSGTLVNKIEKTPEGFSITADDEKVYTTRAVLIATGADRRRLTIPGAAEFEGKGVVYCASCDGPLFAGMDTVVVGGGNAGVETALQLLAYTKSVTLLEYSEEPKAEKITIEKTLADPKMKLVTNAEITEIKGEKMVTGVSYKDRGTRETHELPAGGVFVEIGLVPNTKLTEGLLEMDKYKRIITNPKNQHTSVEGIWAAGDCTDELYHQNNIASGDGVKALEDIFLFLKGK